MLPRPLAFTTHGIFGKCVVIWRERRKNNQGDRPGQSLVVSDDLIACDSDGEPPAAYNRDLINVCTLTTDLGAVPKTLFTRLTTTRGLEFDNLDFTLEMIVESAGLAFELKVDGYRYGRVEADFH